MSSKYCLVVKSGRTSSIINGLTGPAVCKYSLMTSLIALFTYLFLASNSPLPVKFSAPVNLAANLLPNVDFPVLPCPIKATAIGTSSLCLLLSAKSYKSLTLQIKGASYKYNKNPNVCHPSPDNLYVSYSLTISQNNCNFSFNSSSLNETCFKACPPSPTLGAVNNFSNSLFQIKAGLGK